ncbi:MAG: YciE/YciF ferroxidase family protein [Aequorivita sp.]
MNTLKKLFEHQLKDLHSAESQLVGVLIKMIKNATDIKLIKAFENHLEETKNHQIRLEEICFDLNISPSGERCMAMEDWIKNVEGFLKEDIEKEVKDIGLISGAQCIEHYEISGYGTAVRYAKELGHDDIAKKLQETLNEEYNCDEKLTAIAEDRLNRIAMEKL